MPFILYLDEFPALVHARRCDAGLLTGGEGTGSTGFGLILAQSGTAEAKAADSEGPAARCFAIRRPVSASDSGMEECASSWAAAPRPSMGGRGETS